MTPGSLWSTRWPWFARGVISLRLGGRELPLRAGCRLSLFAMLWTIVTIALGTTCTSLRLLGYRSDHLQFDLQAMLRWVLSFG